MYKDLNDVSKIVILSTFSQPRNLSEISKKWFGNKTRFYLDVYTKQIKEGVKSGFITKDSNKYAANSNKILKEVIKSIEFEFKEKKSKEYLDKYLKKLEYFYIDLSEYTTKTYLDLTIIRILAKDGPEKAASLDLKFLIQLPFFLRYAKFKDISIFNLLLKLSNLKEYYNLIMQHERENLHILDKKKLILAWADTYKFITRSYYPQFMKEDPNLLQDNLDPFILMGGGENEKV